LLALALAVIAHGFRRNWAGSLGIGGITHPLGWRFAFGHFQDGLDTHE